VGERVLAGEADLVASHEEYDWLGSGVYFWESDPVRAREWAEAKVARTRYADPFVIGAVIDLGNCLDLLVRENISLLRLAFEDLEAQRVASRFPMPRNADFPHDRHKDKLLRKLDCAVINNLHAIIASTPADSRDRPEAFDTVRGLFTEGAPVYPGAGFHELTHTQIAVRTAKSIRGLFRPRDLVEAPPIRSKGRVDEARSGDRGGSRTVLLGSLRISV
jgi:hypothetical protein